MRILAVIVTYNRSRLLERCIDHVRLQTRPVDGLLVINNSSVDDTLSLLERKAVECITQTNSGGAGGFNRAVEEARRRGYDAVWLMDDDGFPHDAALSALVLTLQDAGVACACPLVVREDQPTHFVWPFPRLDADNQPAIFARKRKLPTIESLRLHAGAETYPFAHLFNGTLLRVSAIDRIGTIDAGFFVSGDEVDFAMRLMRERSILSNLSALHFHPDVAKRPISDESFYYYVKNTIIINNRYANNPTLRSGLSLAAALARTAKRNSIANAISFVTGRRFPILARALRRGAAGRIGKDFVAVGGVRD